MPALEQEAAATFQQAEAFGSHANGLGHPPESLFDDVYATMPAHLRSQLSELQVDARQTTSKTARFCRSPIASSARRDKQLGPINVPTLTPDI